MKLTLINKIHAPLYAYGHTKEEVETYNNYIKIIEKNAISSFKHERYTGWQGDYLVAGYLLKNNIVALISDNMEYGISHSIEYYKMSDELMEDIITIDNITEKEQIMLNKITYNENIRGKLIEYAVEKIGKNAKKDAILDVVSDIAKSSILIHRKLINDYEKYNNSGIYRDIPTQISDIERFVIKNAFNIEFYDNNLYRIV